MAARTLAVLLAAFIATACTTYSTHISPSPTPVGDLRIGVNATGLAVSRGASADYLPGFEMTFRYGLSERVDIGGRLNMFGAQANAKVVLIDGAVAMAVVPGAGVGVGALGNDRTRSVFVSFSCPVLVGVSMNDRTQLVAGLKPLVQVSGGIGINGKPLNTGDFLLTPGAVIGVRAKFESFVLFPELNVHVPYDFEGRTLLRILWQAGLAVQFAVTP